MSAAITEPLSRNNDTVETSLRLRAHRIGSDEEALAIARVLAQKFAVGAAERDRNRILPKAELDEFSGGGLWAISIPKAFGGAGLTHTTIVEMFRTIAEADPSIAQIAHNHFCVVDAIRLEGSEKQKAHYFEEVLKGKRFGNAFSEAGTKDVMDFQTKIEPDGNRAANSWASASVGFNSAVPHRLQQLSRPQKGLPVALRRASLSPRSPSRA
jgi:alkylation response protein AidB-like acyl-CoA dehydrogenase